MPGCQSPYGVELSKLRRVQLPNVMVAPGHNSTYGQKAALKKVNVDLVAVAERSAGLEASRPTSMCWQIIQTAFFKATNLTKRVDNCILALDSNVSNWCIDLWRVNS